MYGTARKAYIDILIELVKEDSPTLYLEDFLYYFNKAVSEYLKARYEIFEVTQQLSDDLRYWKKTYTTNSLVTDIDIIGNSTNEDYRHLLNCIIDVRLTRPVVGCDQAAQVTVKYKATRMTSTIKAGLLNNDYLKAQFNRPYFDISDNTITVDIGDTNDKVVKVDKVAIEYLKQPKLIDLTEEEIAAEADTSQILEFSSDIGEEINKVALKLILERGSNPRTQSQVAVNQSINDVSVRNGGS
ncbi:MAG: hypothetical protein KAH32_03105 [Chlamydiia bacterium]|nr:hypothetical protein [Chlamydiia bacterium]